MSETKPPSNWREQIANRLWGVKLLERLQSAAGIERIRRLNERLVKNNQDQLMGASSDVDEDMYQIGDSHTTINQQKPFDYLPWILALLGGGAALYYSQGEDPVTLPDGKGYGIELRIVE